MNWFLLEHGDMFVNLNVFVFVLEVLNVFVSVLEVLNVFVSVLEGFECIYVFIGGV